MHVYLGGGGEKRYGGVEENLELFCLAQHIMQ